MTLYSEERYVEEIDKDVDFSIHTEKTYIDGVEESECVTDVTWEKNKYTALENEIIEDIANGMFNEYI